MSPPGTAPGGRAKGPEVATTTRFEWSALPAELLEQLRHDFELSGDDVAGALAARFGPEPNEGFVKEAWPALRDRWLAKDPAVRRAVVSALRARELGATSIGGSSARAEVAYLRTCRNAPTLRAVVLSQLLALGHGAREEPFGVEQLRAQVKEVVRVVLGADEVAVDEDGNIPIRTDASLTYVRVFSDTPIVRVFSPILWAFGEPADIEETVNEINRHTNWVKAVWENGTVVLFSDVVGRPLADSQLAAAIQSVVRRADEMGPLLQQRYGGRTAFGAPQPPRQPPPTGGYL